MIEISAPGGPARAVSLGAFVTELQLARATVAPAFDAARLKLVAGVSAQILAQGVSRASPGVIHFAYWTRRQALKSLADAATARLPARCIARPRGMVFHLPPQNVETVFLYSWVISYLCGNANLTRLPTELGPDMAGLLALFQAALEATGDHGQYFVRYPVDQAANQALSAASDARVVWGGDAKVAAFAAFPLRNGGKALWFGDRRSLAMVNGDSVEDLTADQSRDLAARLHNDVFVFDQMACSSPIRLFVVGSEAAHGRALNALLRHLSDAAVARGSAPATGHVIQKMVSAMAMAASGEASGVTRHSNALTTVTTGRAQDYHPVGGGFLEVVYVPTLASIHPSLGENVQTLVHFGFGSDELRGFAANLPPYCVTRIVPMGQALDFDVVWDGYDLFSELTQLLRIQ